MKIFKTEPNTVFRRNYTVHLLKFCCSADFLVLYILFLFLTTHCALYLDWALILSIILIRAVLHEQRRGTGSLTVT